MHRQSLHDFSCGPLIVFSVRMWHVGICHGSWSLAGLAAPSRAPFIFRIFCLVTQSRCTAEVQVAPDGICSGLSTLHPASRRRITLSSCTALHHDLMRQPKDLRSDSQGNVNTWSRHSCSCIVMPTDRKVTATSKHDSKLESCRIVLFGLLQL